MSCFMADGKQTVEFHKQLEISLNQLRDFLLWIVSRHCALKACPMAISNEDKSPGGSGSVVGNADDQLAEVLAFEQTDEGFGLENAPIAPANSLQRGP